MLTEQGDAEGEKVADNLAVLRAFGATAWSDGDTSYAKVRLALKWRGWARDAWWSSSSKRADDDHAQFHQNNNMTHTGSTTPGRNPRIPFHTRAFSSRNCQWSPLGLRS